MSTFKENDFVINADPYDDNYLYRGRVCRPDNGVTVQVELIDGTIQYWNVDECVPAAQSAKVSKAFAMMHQTSQAIPAPPLKRGDRVRYIGTENIKFKNGVVDMVYIDINLNGSQTVADVFDDPFMYTAITIAELEVIPAATGSHYQPVMDSTGDEPVKKPFDHDQLGTDLSGDDLMKSIRDFCEGNY